MSTNAEGPDYGTAEEQALARFLEGEPEPGDGAVLAEAVERDADFAAEVRRLLRVDDLLRQAHEFDDCAFADAILTRLTTQEDGDAFTQSVAEQLPDTTPLTEPARREVGRTRTWGGWRVAVAAGLLLAIGGLGVAQLALPGKDRGERDVAWLVNAQNCRWAEGGEPRGTLGVGTTLQLQSGLAELSFAGGATVVLQGPASLELLSGNSAHLLRGRLTARVPDQAHGFTIVSPEGKVVDLGTEFGINVADDGSAEVVVFKGEVRAERGGTPLSVKQDQSARLTSAGVEFGRAPDAKQFVKAIKLPPVIVPVTRTVDFRTSVEGTITDKAGLGTGFTHRLPGTGESLAVRDEYLSVVPDAGLLHLTATQSDLNGSLMLAQGEYLGFRLADLGFTGTEDFEVAAEFAKAPLLGDVDQFGLYAGSRADCNIRGGLMRPGSQKGMGDATQIFVQNDGGKDTDLCKVGLVEPGNKITMTLRRVGGKYSMSIHDTAKDVTTDLSMRHPAFLDREKDVYVGLFGATPRRMVARTIQVDKVTATVWTRTQP